MIRQGSKAGLSTLAFYPGCGREALLENAIRITAPISLFLAADDEEVSATICQHVADRSIGTTIGMTLYLGATHDFDDPGEKRQSVPANAVAKADAMTKAAGLVEGFSRVP